MAAGVVVVAGALGRWVPPCCSFCACDYDERGRERGCVRLALAGQADRRKKVVNMPTQQRCDQPRRRGAQPARARAKTAGRNCPTPSSSASPTLIIPLLIPLHLTRPTHPQPTYLQHTGPGGRRGRLMLRPCCHCLASISQRPRHQAS